MYNEINKEEKLTKEERDILERNLKVCFETIFKDPDTKSFDMKDIENKERFLKKFSPWHKTEGQKLIQDFVDNVNNDNSTNDFSWLDILDEDSQWKKSGNDKIKKEVKDKSKHVNMRYQIPTHFHGDIDNAVIFHCMENPRGYLGDWSDNEIDTEFQGVNLNEFYKKSAGKLKEESVTSREIIEKRYKLEDIDDIRNIIYSEESNLLQELNHMFNKQKDYFFDAKYIFKNSNKSDKELFPYYYIREYYRQILRMTSSDISKYSNKDNNNNNNNNNNNRINALDIAKKICNVEIYPFSSSEPNLDKKGIGNTIFLDSELSRFGIYILVRRIYKYLQEVEKGKKDAQKPVIIFRKYDKVWRKLLGEILTEEDIVKLEDDFFYCQLQPRGGGITSGNVISVLILKRISDKLKENKKEDFNSIKSLLTKVEI